MTDEESEEFKRLNELYQRKGYLTLVLYLIDVEVDIALADTELLNDEHQQTIREVRQLYDVV